MSNYTKGTNFTAKDSLVTGNPSKLVKGSEIDAELTAIAAAIATKEDATSVDTKLALKASLAGATYTGTHDFTSGTTTAATPASTDNSTNVATTAMVQQVAMNAALPSQTGNAGKFVKTDGTNASWDYAGISTVGATVTDNYTIVGTTPTIWPVATTALGKSITAPAVTTSTPKGLFAVIDNKAGGYPVGWRDSTGTLIMAVAAGGVAQVYLEDNSTAAGVWRVNGSNLEPGLITIDSTFSSTYASTVLAPFVALDSNTSIHFAALSSGFAAFVVDNTGKVLTTPVTVSSTASDVPCQAFKVSATSAIVFFGQTGTAVHKAVVVTLSGSSPSYSLAVGTSQTLTAGTSMAAWGGEDFSGAPKIAQLSSTSYLASYVTGTFTACAAISVSGATVSIGAATTIISANSVTNSTTTYALTATTALVLYKTSPASYTNWAVVVSVSGTTCTVGTPASSSNQGSTTAVPSSCLLSPTKVLVVDDNNAAGVYANTFVISGTTVTTGANFAVEAGVTSTPTYSGNSATRYNPHLFPLSSSAALLWYLDSSSVSRAVVLSESGGTVTAGTIVYKSISAAAANASGYGALLPQGTSDFVSIVEQVVSTAGFKNAVIPSKISGTAITTGRTKTISQWTTDSPVNIKATRMSDGKYVLSGSIGGTWTSSPEYVVLSTNGDDISIKGTIGTPILGVQNTNPVAVSPNRIVVSGYQPFNTPGAGSNGYFRLLNVEIAA